jgi:hypothetical protein
LLHGQLLHRFIMPKEGTSAAADLCQIGDELAAYIRSNAKGTQLKTWRGSSHSIKAARRMIHLSIRQ